MHRDPAGRYPTAEKFRLVLNDFIQHIGSARLELRAQRRLEVLINEIHLTSQEETEHRQRLYNLFRECRFGFLQAIELWSNNQTAIEGFRRSTEVMIEYELLNGDVRSASTLMAELDQPSPDLKRRMDEALQAAEQKQQRIEKLEKLGEQLDMRVGQRERAIWAAVIGVLWTLSPLMIPLGMRYLRTNSHLTYIGFLTLLLLFLGALRWFGHEDVMRSTISRRLLGAALVAISCTIILNVVGMILGLSPETVLVFWPFCWFCVTVMIVITVDLRLIPMASGFLAALFVSATRPDLSYFAMIACNLLATVNMFYIWAPQRWES
jgi:serine/threonine-protein kinase